MCGLFERMNMGDLTFGIDISFYQASTGLTPRRFFDPVQAKANGVNFAFIKASERMATDNAVETFARTFADAGLLHGFYHFARPAEAGASALDQANYFWSVIKDYYDDLEGTLPPVLDVEKDGVGLSFIKVFLERIYELSGRRPILYTSPSFWDDLSASENALWILDYPLWLANYFTRLTWPVYGIPDVVKNATKMPTLPDPWKKKGYDWKFWQYTAGGDGHYYGGQYNVQAATGLDLNVYNGSLFDLLTEFNVESGSSNDPVVDDPIDVGETENNPPKTHVRVIARQSNGSGGWLFFRDRPELYDGACLAIGYGTELELIMDSPKVTGDVDYWHVLADGREGYVSAGSAYTELV